MAAEYVIDGPIVRDITAIDTVPQYPLNARVVTNTVGVDKVRIYRYVKYLNAAYVGVPVVISSVGRLLYSANATNAGGLSVGVSQVTLTSPTASQASLYAFVQTGGYFDNTGAFGGPGIYTNSAVANSELYLTTTDGTCSTAQSATVVSLGAKALSTGSSSNVYAFSEDELNTRKDWLV